MQRRPAAMTIGLIAVLLLALGLVACSGDGTAVRIGDGTAAPTADAIPPDAEAIADEAAFCDAAMALGAPGEPEVDWETATEEEVEAAEEIFAEEQLYPVVSDLRTSGPPEIRDHVQTLEQGLIEEGLDAFFGGEGGEARIAIADEASDRCGWASVDVTMVDYGFERVPDTIEAGTSPSP